MAKFDEELQRSIDSAADLMLKSKYVIGLTGAGVSVESGIRPFRGPGGLWTEYGEPPMDGYQRFLADPKREWEKIIRREGYLGVSTKLLRLPSQTRVITRWLSLRSWEF